MGNRPPQANAEPFLADVAPLLDHHEHHADRANMHAYPPGSFPRRETVGYADVNDEKEEKSMSPFDVEDAASLNDWRTSILASSYSAYSPSHLPQHSHSGNLHSLHSSFRSLAMPTQSDVYLRILNDDSDSLAAFGPYQLAAPEDIFVLIFSYLSQKDLATCAGVSKRWHRIAYEPSLWKVLHLCSMFNRTDDLVMSLLFSSHKFPDLYHLCLDHCGAITDLSLEFIAAACPNLQFLSVAYCSRLTGPAILKFLSSANSLRKLELYGILTFDVLSIIPLIEEIRPGLDLCLAYMQYCAELGMLVPRTRYVNPEHLGRKFQNTPNENVRTLHQTRVSSTSSLSTGTCEVSRRRGVTTTPCWGPIKGRLLMSSMNSHTAGNYPYKIVYLCRKHKELNEFAFTVCQICDQAMDQRSMWNDMICKVCFDSENLANVKNWIPLDNQTIKEFGFSDIVSKTIRIADRKNLPHSLRSYGVEECTLDYSLPVRQSNSRRPSIADPLDSEADPLLPSNEESLLDPTPRPLISTSLAASHHQNYASTIDPTHVPLSTFLSHNSGRLDRTVTEISKKLVDAKKENNIRALLVFQRERNIEVLADSRVIASGIEGEAHLRIIQQVWYHFLPLFYPLIFILGATGFFVPQIHRLLEGKPTGIIDYLRYIEDDSEEEISTMWIVVLSFGVGFFSAVVIVLFCRFRRLFELFCKYFLALDICAMFLSGFGVMVSILFAWFQIPLDWFVLIFITAQMSTLCILSLYFKAPQSVHQFAAASLNMIMAMLLVGTIGGYFAIALVCICAVGDLLTEYRPGMIRFLPALFIPDAFVIPQTPRILYPLGSLHLRPYELMLYAMMATLIPSITLSVIMLLSTFTLITLVFPFALSNRKCTRPLPWMFIVSVFMLLFHDMWILPFLFSVNGVM